MRAENVKKELSELVSIRLRGLVADQAYNGKKRELEDERVKLKEFIGDDDQTFTNVIDRTMEVYRFASRAKEMFEKGDLEGKRDILSFTSSHLILKDKILHTEPHKPLFYIQRTLESPATARAFMVAPSDLREAQRKGEPFVKGFRDWQAQLHDVSTFCRKKDFSPTLKILLARILHQHLPALAA